MREPNSAILAVPTNVITGFLGVGKTSAILHLLSSKPADENWAVLVNEFGEIGIDGGLLSGNHKEASGVFIKEVPGGCMCCAAGVPMQIALNQLLQQAKPDRLLIEPTGLGHPKEVLQVLSSEHYSDVLDLQKIITLVDARKLSDQRYTEHETFNQQIAMADVVVGNKVDLYANNENAILEDYVRKHAHRNTKIALTQNGEISAELLEGNTNAVEVFNGHHHHHGRARELASEAELPECGYLSAINSGEGYQSIGWRFAPKYWFSRKKLFSFLGGLQVERMKAVFITEDGIFAYNLTSDTMTERELDECVESRVEIIAADIDQHWEKTLLDCVAQTRDAYS